MDRGGAGVTSTLSLDYIPAPAIVIQESFGAAMEFECSSSSLAATSRTVDPCKNRVPGARIPVGHLRLRRPPHRERG